MQIELLNEKLDVQILGVNRQGKESGNELIIAGRTIPWLAELEEQNVWGEWKVSYRDVVIIDKENMVVEVYNLSQNSLEETTNYDYLKSQIRDAVPTMK